MRAPLARPSKRRRKAQGSAESPFPCEQVMTYQQGTLASEIRLFRRHKRISQDKAANELGVCRRCYQNIENGSKPNRSTYLKLADWTGLPLEALFELKTK